MCGQDDWHCGCVIIMGAFADAAFDTAPPIEMEFKEFAMDSKKHFAKRFLSVLCLASVCMIFCMLAGCEEELMTASDTPIQHTHDTEAGLDGIAEAAREARAALDEKFLIKSPGMASDKPYVVSDEEIAMAVEEITEEKPFAQPALYTEKPFIIAALDTVIIEPDSTEDVVVAENTEEEAFKADEKEAIAVLAQDIGLKIPTPAENAELLKETKISVPSLDNMHIATAPLVSENGQPESEEPEAIGEDFAETTDSEAIAETDQPIEEDESRGFFKKIGSTVGNAVGSFTAKHYFILGGAIVFVAALIYLKNKKMVSLTPWRKK